MTEFGDAAIDDSLLKLLDNDEGDNGVEEAGILVVLIMVEAAAGDVLDFSSTLRLLKVAVVVVDVSGGPHL